MMLHLTVRSSCAVCVDAVAGSKHLALLKDLSAVLHWTAVSLPLQDARGKT